MYRSSRWQSVTVARGLAIIIASAIGFGLASAAPGCLLGVAVPRYYRAVYRTADREEFNPVEVGLGRGLSQGLIAGLCVGAVVVLAVAWYRSRVPGADEGGMHNA